MEWALTLQYLKPKQVSGMPYPGMGMELMSITEMFRNLLPEHFEYDFFDAEHEIAAAEGCGEIFPGPYTCWYPVPTNANVKSAHQVVEELIQEEGPYDVVMGFSQVRSRLDIWLSYSS